MKTTKSKGVGWLERVARTAEKRNARRVLVEKPIGRNQLEDLDVDGRVRNGS
jgi:hypothetical protein